ncbi:MAG: chromosomal replication initiator protein DnaA [Magnetococcales bacterium]|nr:chromosomal replication initiator protein DnaA [Magnetococcales bacterium]
MDDQLWERTLEAVKEQVSHRVFETWIEPLRPSGPLADGHLELLTGSSLSSNLVQSRYGSLLESCLSSEAGCRVRLSFRVDPDAVPEATDPDPADDTAPPTTSPIQGTGLDTRYRFETFVVGGCNQFVHAAAERVAELPAQGYNPLFIHGGVGLGKTHIMQAIGNRILQTRPDLKVLYISSEKFMTQLINSLRNQGIMAFKDKFRSVDVLLVDDIQFIAGKKATQEEFFHTFNALYEANRQIVLTSDSFPSEIEQLEERLRSRFGMGLVADIQPPELETRVAILKQKAAQENMDLQDDVAFFLAEAVRTNVRELEGALIRVSAHASLTGKPVTLGLVKESLRDLIKGQDRPVSIEGIQKTVCGYYKIRLADMLSAKRSRIFSHPRQVAMYLSKQLTRHSYPEIAHQFGGRDHTTVLYAVGSIDKKRAADSGLTEELETLTAMLRK